MKKIETKMRLATIGLFLSLIGICYCSLEYGSLTDYAFMLERINISEKVYQDTLNEREYYSNAIPFIFLFGCGCLFNFLANLQDKVELLNKKRNA